MSQPTSQLCHNGRKCKRVARKATRSCSSKYVDVSTVPYLVAAPERPLDPDLGRVLLVLLLVALELPVKGVAQLPRPGPVRLGNK